MHCVNCIGDMKFDIHVSWIQSHLRFMLEYKSVGDDNVLLNCKIQILDLKILIKIT